MCSSQAHEQRSRPDGRRRCTSQHTPNTSKPCFIPSGSSYDCCALHPFDLQGSKRQDSRMSPHAAKARGIFDRAAVAPIGGHEGMPEDASRVLLEDQPLMGNAQPAEKNDGLMSELNIFDASGSVAGGSGDGGGAADEELPMGWPSTRLVRSASMSSTGSAEAEESEVSRTCMPAPLLRYCTGIIGDMGV